MRKNRFIERKQYLQGKELLLPELYIELLQLPYQERIIELEDLRCIANKCKVLKQFNTAWTLYSNAFDQLIEESSRPRKKHHKTHLKLHISSRGNIANTLTNYIIILNQDNNLKNKIVYDEFFDELQLSPSVPRINNTFTVEDLDKLTDYLKNRYGLTSKEKLHVALEVSIKSKDTFLDFVQCCIQEVF